MRARFVARVASRGCAVEPRLPPPERLEPAREALQIPSFNIPSLSSLTHSLSNTMSIDKTGYVALPTEAAAPPAYTAEQPSQPEGGLIREVLSRTERLVLLQPAGVQPMQIGGARNSKNIPVGVSSPSCLPGQIT